MNQINSTICVRPERLNFPLPTFHPRVGHSFAITVDGTPDDCTGLFVRIFKTDGSYFDFPGNYRPGGQWLVYVIGTAFAAAGMMGGYEVHATDAHGNKTALGTGLVEVGPFSITTTPITPGSTITIAQVPTADGSFVQIRMVQDSSGEWVYEALTPNGGNV